MLASCECYALTMNGALDPKIAVCTYLGDRLGLLDCPERLDCVQGQCAQILIGFIFIVFLASLSKSVARARSLSACLRERETICAQRQRYGWRMPNALALITFLWLSRNYSNVLLMLEVRGDSSELHAMSLLVMNNLGSASRMWLQQRSHSRCAEARVTT